MVAETNQKKDLSIEEYSTKTVRDIIKRYYRIETPTKAHNVDAYQALEKAKRYHEEQLEEAKKGNSELDPNSEIAIEILYRNTVRYEIRKFQDVLFEEIEFPLTTRDALNLMRVTIPRDLSGLCHGTLAGRAVCSFWQSKPGKWVVGIMSAIIGAVIAAILIKKYLGL